MKKILIVIFSIVLAGCGDQPGVTPVEQNFTIPFKGTPTEAQKAQISTAAQTMFQLCPSLLGYMPDVTINEGAVMPGNTNTASADRGWKEFVEITLKVSDRPTVIPREFYAAGHSCYFEISGTELMTSKATCAKLCQGADAVAPVNNIFFVQAK